MRKEILVSVTILIMAAGSVSAGVLDFGIKGGINIANIYGDDVEDGGDWKNGFAGGVFFDWGITPVFGIQPELLYVQNGTRDEFLNADLFLKFNYIQVPVIAKFNLPVGGPMIPVLSAGGYFGFLLDSKLTAEAGDESATGDLEDYTKSYDAGLVFGAALEFSAGPGRMILEGRYNLGMTEIDDGLGTGITGIEDIEKSDMKNQSWMIMVGFAF